jgi:hypothetical protein
MWQKSMQQFENDYPSNHGHVATNNNFEMLIIIIN